MGARPLLLALTASLAIAACGPSLRRVHRASGYFEACYAADLDARVPDDERRACWQAWKRYYRAGADPERLDYVRERLAMLDPENAAAILLATGDDGSIETIEEEAATSGDQEAITTVEPPPPTAAEVDVEVEAPQAPTPSEAAPPDGTEERDAVEARHARVRERHARRGIVAPSTLTPNCPCDEAWRACSGACLADDRGCVGACRREHTLCSRSCY